MSRPRFRPTLPFLLVAVSGLALVAACADEEPAPLSQEDARAVQHAESLSGGTATVLDATVHAFSFVAPSVGAATKDTFFLGNSVFNAGWVAAPASATGFDGLGPLFNVGSCSGCHFKDGRGAPPAEGKPFLGLLFRLSVPGEDAHGGPAGEPTYGGQLATRSISKLPAEGKPVLTYTERPGAYDDGTAFSLRVPSYRFDELGYGPMRPDVMVSPRVAPAMVGLGLLEAVTEADLLTREDPYDRDGDGISGRANRVWDVRANALVLGRFGWKANQPTVEQQTAGAFLGDLGISSSLFPQQDCTDAQTDCLGRPDGGSPELTDLKLGWVTFYSRTLAVPARRDVGDPVVQRGKALFAAAGCASCHVPELRTGAFAPVPELADQTIRPYTDLLLHDLGEGLADHRPDFDASGTEWRTPPLWGVGLVQTVNRHDNLLHDGRARGFSEAVLWHDGEAARSRGAFAAMPAEDRAALVRFLGSLLENGSPPPSMSRPLPLVTVVLALAAAAAFFPSVSLVACSEPEKKAEVDRQRVLGDTAELVIRPTYASLVVAAGQLTADTAALRDAPSEASLAAAQISWKSARLPWMESRAFLFGPVEDDGIKDLIDFPVTAPADVETEAEAEPEPTQEYVAALGGRKRGFQALEVLLFDPSGNAALLAKLTEGPRAARRRAYIAALATHLAGRTQALADAWDPAKGNFLAQLRDAGVSSTKYASQKEAVDALLNAIVFAVEDVSDNRLGQPLGIRAGGVLQPDSIVSRRSDNAVAEISAYLKGVDEVYRCSRGGVSGVSLSAAVKRESERADGETLFAIEAASEATAAIASPFESALSGDLADVTAAREAARSLKTILASEVASILGLTIKFNTNDGD